MLRPHSFDFNHRHDALEHGADIRLDFSGLHDDHPIAALLEPGVESEYTSVQEGV